MEPANARHQPLVSVVLVSFNGRRHLERCLPAVLATRGVDFETILVDNASADDTVAWVRAAYPAVRVLPQTGNLGFGEANRRGIEAARARDYVALLNPDTEVDSDWLERLLAPLEREPDLAATCAVLAFLDEPELLNADGGGMTWLGIGFDRDLGHPRGILDDRAAVAEVLFPTAAAAVLRRSDFQAAGGFDRAMFMYHEDVDLGWRLWLAGKRVVVCRDVVVRHAWGGSTSAAGGAAWRDLMGGRHAVRTLLKCYEPYNLLRALKNLAKTWVRQRSWRMLLRVGAWNLLRLPSTLAARRRIQSSRVLADADLFFKGLIDEAPVPPPPPLRPPLLSPENLLVRNTLWPGQSSANGRLGPGWYGPERIHGELARYTCGLARCVLRVPPARAGELQLRLAAPPGARARNVEVKANGAKKTAELTALEWRLLTLPVTSSSAGFIELEIRSPRSIAHHFHRDWDFRPLGCAVAHITFMTADATLASRSRSVSVVIPTYNRANALIVTLEALASQTCPPLEAVVVDDGSTDDTWERVRAWSEANRSRLRVTPLRQANAGPGAARNRGVAATTGELVLFIGDDTIPDARLIEAHLARHAELEDDCAVVGLTEWDHEAMPVTPFLEHVNTNGEQFAYGQFDDGDEMPFNCFYTSNVSLPRRLLAGDGFRPDFRHAAWEDAELGYRLALRGLRIVYCSEARTRHRHPMTMAQFLVRQSKVGETVPVLFDLHPELAGAAGMPGLRTPARYPLWALSMPFLVHVLSAWDARGRRLPTSFYREAILWSYFRGLRRARRTRQ